MTREELSLVQRLVRDQSGIVVEADKEYLVETRLDMLARRLGMRRVSELLDRARDESDKELRRELVEAITNGETSFFRDPSMFDMLRRDLVPKLIEARERERRLVVWSAACSTGQEPYSLLMMLREHFPVLSSWDVQLYATDFSLAHLERARGGRYSQYEVNRGLPAAMLVRHFDQNDAGWAVHRELRESVQFSRLNLLTDWPPASSIDLVLLRNVMIYWELETKQLVLGRLKHVLARDGALILGAAESLLTIDESFERVAASGTSYYVLPRPASSAPPYPTRGAWG